VARGHHLELDALDEAAGHLAEAQRAVALTGAGMSVESGIPDFRSDQGLWRRYPPQEYATLSAFLANPGRCWEMLRSMGAVLAKAEPHEGHRALAQMERIGLLRAVITQNIDGLHRRAGSQQVFEVHGSVLGLHCPACGFRDRRATPPDRGWPRCPRCTGPTKPPVVLFEEALPARVMAEAEALASSSDLLLVIGTSLAVYPVAALPALAARRGSALVEINLEPGHLRAYGALQLRGGAAGVLPLLLERALQSR